MCECCCGFYEDEFPMFDAVQDAIDALPSTNENDGKGTKNIIMAIARVLGSEADSSLVPDDTEEINSVLEMWYTEDATTALLDLITDAGTLNELADDICFLMDTTTDPEEVLVLSVILDLMLVGVYYNVYKESHGIGQEEVMKAIRSANVIN